MNNLARFLVVLFLLCSFSSAQGQKKSPDAQSVATPLSSEKSKRELLQEAQLKTLLSKVGVSVVVEAAERTGQPQTYREAKIRWADSMVSDHRSLNVQEYGRTPNVTVVEDKKRFGTLPRHRSLELSSTHIFIAAVDKKNNLRWWSIIADPRVVRGEFPTSSGELQSKNYYLPNTTSTVAFPDDPKIVTLRFYFPLWNGTDFGLRPLAIVPVQ